MLASRGMQKFKKRMNDVVASVFFSFLERATMRANVTHPIGRIRKRMGKEKDVFESPEEPVTSTEQFFVLGMGTVLTSK